MRIGWPTRRIWKCAVLLIAGAPLTAELFLIGAWHAFPLPEGMLHAGPAGSLVLDNRHGVLLDVTAEDEMRRLPIALDAMSPWIPAAVIAAEDARFTSHAGIDLPAVAGAMVDNIAAGRIVRGASTITMQVAGMQLGHPRTWLGKAVEGFRALQIEASYDKDRILEAWLNMAPFGGNITGIEAASRTWLGKPAADCSLSEAALLVGLPKSPERFRPDRHAEAAMDRRDVVLNRMATTGVITAKQLEDALRDRPLLLPQTHRANDRHAAWMASTMGAAAVRHSTIDPDLQTITETIVGRHMQHLPESVDVSVVLVELESGAVRSLVGSSDPEDPIDGQVNGATSLRSPGSALKPFVYAAAFEQRRLTPESIVDDAPIDVQGWRPRNIDRTWMGALTAADALSLSRNAPALRIADDIGLGHVVSVMRRCGLPIGAEAARRAGLSLAVGGLEVTPWSLAEAYATLARGGMHMPLRLLETEPATVRRALPEEVCTALEHCLAGDATDDETVLPFVAAKTGTSSGHRDAIAGGWNGAWASVVWVGRFDGGSDPVLLGADAAMPILLELLHHPSLATGRPMRTVSHWPITRPVGRASQPTPTILDPRDGDVICADGDQIRITPTVQWAGHDAVLFLDGAPVEQGSIPLSPGAHELRLVQPGFAPSLVRFSVIPSN